MTDVLILKKIPGFPAGAVTEITDRLQKHVDAGNAKIIPADTERDAPLALAPEPEPEQDDHSYTRSDEMPLGDDDEDTGSF